MHAVQEEDVLNCDGTSASFWSYIISHTRLLGVAFPQTLSEAGLMDASGFLYYRESVLVDLGVPTNTLVVRKNVIVKPILTLL